MKETTNQEFELRRKLPTRHAKNGRIWLFNNGDFNPERVKKAPAQSSSTQSESPSLDLPIATAVPAAESSKTAGTDPFHKALSEQSGAQEKKRGKNEADVVIVQHESILGRKKGLLTVCAGFIQQGRQIRR